MKKIRKSAGRVFLIGIVIAGFLLVPFLHGSHTFPGEEDPHCYICKFAKNFTFPLAVFIPFIFAFFVFRTLADRKKSLARLDLISAFISRAPPCF